MGGCGGGEAVSGGVGIGGGGGIRGHSEAASEGTQRALKAAHLSCVALSTSARKPDDSTARASMMARSAELRAARAAALTPPAAKADRTVAVGSSRGGGGGGGGGGGAWGGAWGGA